MRNDELSTKEVLVVALLTFPICAGIGILFALLTTEVLVVFALIALWPFMVYLVIHAPPLPEGNRPEGWGGDPEPGDASWASGPDPEDQNQAN